MAMDGDGRFEYGTGSKELTKDCFEGTSTGTPCF